MSKDLKISVVTVSFNAAKNIEETILSVVDQTYDNIEYVVIDGGSTDGTVDIIKKYTKGGSEYDKHKHGISCLTSESDKGIYDAMNKGINLATGVYINFMNAGDKFYENGTITKVMNLLEGVPDVAFGSVIRNSSSKEKTIKPTPFFYQTKKLKDPGICHQSTFVKTIHLKKHLFDTSYKIAADFDLLVKLWKNNAIFQELPLTISFYDSKGISSLCLADRFRDFARISGLKTLSLEYQLRLLNLKIKDYLRIHFGYNVCKD